LSEEDEAARAPRIGQPAIIHADRVGATAIAASLWDHCRS